MLISVTFSKPSTEVENLLGKAYKKIRIKTNSSSIGQSFFAEFFTEKQAFHKTFSETELNDFITQHAGTTFKNCVQRFDDKEITILANNKGKISKIVRKISLNQISQESSNSKSHNAKNSKYFSNQDDSNFRSQFANGTIPQPTNHNRIKNYIIAEGTPVPFLISLGVMTPDGKVVNSRYDKFKQINRFLEYINDILPSVMELKKSESHPLQIADFGCGKSYLTFAVHYFLTQIKKIDCTIVGLDLKKDVIEHCNKLAKDFGCEGLIFKTGNIAEYSDSEPEHNPDIVITLHACDTATDFALKYAVEKKAKAILSVPCCQHEINQQLEKNKKEIAESEASVLVPVLKHGLLRERTAALITDALRADYLERWGYKVDVMEFIDMSHTPKNILLRCVRKSNAKDLPDGKPELLNFLKISPAIYQ
ncbi:MAG: SAM-dependent methyltransferase [Treponema sp.]|nr:SAM-dependent methyltransferase [Treponema sp.]